MIAPLTSSSTSNDTIKLEPDESCSKHLLSETTSSTYLNKNDTKPMLTNEQIQQQKSKLDSIKQNHSDDNEKENEHLNQVVDSNADSQVGHEEIIDGFSFLTFEFESDFKVSVYIIKKLSLCLL